MPQKGKDLFVSIAVPASNLFQKLIKRFSCKLLQFSFFAFVVFHSGQFLIVKLINMIMNGHMLHSDKRIEHSIVIILAQAIQILLC